MKKKNEDLEEFNEEIEKSCDCDKNCEDNEHICHCDDGCECEHCKGEHCECEVCCGEEGEQENNEREATDQYLALAQRIQAEFENYRRRMADQLIIERQEGIISVISAFLPCLDTFKEAKKTIIDEKTLQGVEMIENKILDTLERLKVERIESVWQKFDPNLHDVIAVMHNEDYDEDIILEEYQAGYKYNGKVIRYSKVIVNKREV